MCGIFVVYNPKGLRGDLNRYCEGLRTLTHRGPDDEGYYIDEQIFIGHRRLSILDLSRAGRQPMISSDGNTVLAFNGQIYNHLELRAALESRGHRFVSRSDTETLLAAFIEFGPGVFERLRGMWAVVIWQVRERQLWLSRDRLGMKPLFVYHGAETVLASEPKAIIHYDRQSATLDERSAARYLARGWTDDDDNTFFREIKSFPPASFSRTSDGVFGDPVRFWNLAFDGTANHNVDTLRDAIEDSVSRHLQSDVPVAVTLSGGMDSSTVACFAARVRSAQNVHAFSVIAPNTPDESEFINKTVHETRMSHTYLRIDDLDHEGMIDEVVAANDAPPVSSSQVFQAGLRKAIANEGFKVVLVGEGGDEVLGGYALMLPIFIYSLILSGQFIRAARALAGARDLMGESRWTTLRRVLSFAQSGIGGRTYQVSRHGYSLLSEQFADSDSGMFPATDYSAAKRMPVGRPYYREVLDRFRVDIGSILRVEDRSGMAQGLEVRPPLLDHELIESAWRYPFREFMRSGTNKNLMRKALKGIVPDKIVDFRRKIPRPGNTSHLVSERLRAAVRQHAQNPPAALKPILENDLGKMFEEDLASASPHRLPVWFRFYALSRWAELRLPN